MEHLPKRISLVHETANTLKEWIIQGVLGEALPGEMQLKARLGTSDKVDTRAGGTRPSFLNGKFGLPVSHQVSAL